jgi:UDP:flavonoid glycosyltransferase YjiC (YdhE family)
VLAHRAAAERIERTGAEFVEFSRTFPGMDLTRREGDVLRDWEPRTRLGRRMRVVENALFGFVGDVAADCSEAIQAWRPDVVLFDWMLIGAAIAAEQARLPAVALVHYPYSLPGRGAPPLGMGLRPLAGPLGRWRDGLLRALMGRALAAYGDPIVDRARTEHGLAPLGHWERQLLGAEAIYVMTAPELDFASRGELPANVHYVGPAFEPYPSEWVSPWPAGDDAPLVVISFSTSYMNQRALAQRVLDAIDGMPIRALLTAGPALKDARLRTPANTRIVPFVAHRTVFPHASLVVTHGGWQTVNAALADGVPLVCIPCGRDQPDNSARVLHVGAGVRAGKHSSRHRLRRTIARALADPALREGAQKMARVLARSDGALAVADALERIGPRQGEALTRAGAR